MHGRNTSTDAPHLHTFMDRIANPDAWALCRCSTISVTHGSLALDHMQVYAPPLAMHPTLSAVDDTTSMSSLISAPSLYSKEDEDDHRKAHIILNQALEGRSSCFMCLDKAHAW